MSRPHPAVLLGFFVAVIVAICGVTLLKGGLLLGKHEGDTFHLIAIVFRMAEGQWPHLDFVTPIGALAFWPIAFFVDRGWGIGTSIILGQALSAVAVLPALWWAALTRLSGLAAPLFGLFVLVLIMALVHGEAERSVSISMHYNRWAWAVTFVVLLTAVMAPLGQARSAIDGAIIGAGMFALLLIKVTYFGAFAVPVLLALLLRRAYSTLFAALLAGVALIAALSFVAGTEFWLAYAGDLLSVAGSDVRPFPSEPLGAVMGAPAYLGASLILLFSVIVLRQAGQDLAGLILLLLAPGFFYVTYQNFANDPQWLLLLGVLLLAHVPEMHIRNGLGWNMRNAIRMAAVVALAFAAPSFFNLGYSPFRHLNLDSEAYVPFFARSDVHGDLFAARVRAQRVEQRGPLDVAGTGLVAFADIEEAIEPTVFRGESLPICSIELGVIAWFDEITRDLEQAGLAGPDKSIFAADLFSSHWLFGDFAPVKNGAPWYYGGLPGIENADYLLVPLCPVTYAVRDSILSDIESGPYSVSEIRRTKLYVLFSISKLAS